MIRSCSKLCLHLIKDPLVICVVVASIIQSSHAHLQHSSLFQNDLVLNPRNKEVYIRKMHQSADGILSKISHLQRRHLNTVFDSSTVDESLLYEDIYQLNYYLPMLMFFMLNFLAFLAGVTLMFQNTCEERNDDILEAHKLNHERVVHNSTLNTAEEETVEEEILEVGDLVLSLDATNDDEIELELTER